MNTNALNFLSMLTKGAILVVAVTAQELFQKHGPLVEETRLFTFPTDKHLENPDWNYDKQGTDWDFESCNIKDSMPQSPRNLSKVTDGPKVTYDWSEQYFSFVPKFYPASIQDKGSKDYVYQITLQDTTQTKGFFGFWGAEPFPNPIVNYVVKWSFDHIRFHYPAEHVFNGTKYDLEMQVFHTVSPFDVLIFFFRINSTRLLSARPDRLPSACSSPSTPRRVLIAKDSSTGRSRQRASRSWTFLRCCRSEPR